jgi:hypothetical protein
MGRWLAEFPSAELQVFDNPSDSTARRRAGGRASELMNLAVRKLLAALRIMQRVPQPSLSGCYLNSG